MSMEEYTGRERSPPPDPAENAAAGIPVPNSPTPTGRTFQDDFNSPQMPASPTGGQGLTQEALIEVLRNQHQNIVQQQNLIAGQGAETELKPAIFTLRIFSYYIYIYSFFCFK